MYIHIALKHAENSKIMRSPHFWVLRKIGLNTVFTLAFSAAGLAAFGQNSDEPKTVTETYFIRNAHIVQKPGVILKNHHLIIRKGMIDEIGAAITAPFDAQIIPADSMYVYAGFIDAFSHTGIPKVENKDRPKVTDPGNPPNDIAGITPQFEAIDYYKASDKSVSDLRAAGFVYSHASPRGGMLPGKTSVFSMKDGESDQLMIRSNVAQTSQFQYNRGVYPSTVIGVISKFRELYKNAEIMSAFEEKFSQNPLGLQRPNPAKEWTALYPVVKKKMPVYFVAPDLNDIHRAIALKKELGFDMTLVEVQEGWTMTDEIRKNQVKILLSLDLPEISSKDEKSKKTEKDTISKTIIEEKKKVQSPEEIAFEKRKENAVKDRLAQAAVFEKSGIPFGFSMLNVKPGDIAKNIRMLVKNGLSEQAALSALTTYPASLLGISSYCGTIEKGKSASLIITDKSYFEDKSAIKYQFIEGKKYDYISKPKPKNENAKDGNSSGMAGKWAYSMEVMGQKQTGNLNISMQNGEYAVRVMSDENPAKPEMAKDIKAEGKKMTFYVQYSNGSANMKIDFDLTFDGKTFEGNIGVGDFGSFPVKGEWESDPNF
jgi:imidazolonepropionase-like amidohydrolase